jgi:integrase
VWSGVRRTHGTAQTGKTPAVTADVRAMVEALPGRLIGVRDGALLLRGFAGAFRRAELVGLDVDDVAFAHDGLVVTLRRGRERARARDRAPDRPPVDGGAPPLHPRRLALPRERRRSGRVVGQPARFLARASRRSSARRASSTSRLTISV